MPLLENGGEQSADSNSSGQEWELGVGRRQPGATMRSRPALKVDVEADQSVNSHWLQLLEASDPGVPAAPLRADRRVPC